MRHQLLLLPLVQQAFFNNGSSVEERLDGSLRLLDLCSTARNSLVQMKEAVQGLHSSLRRRKVGESAIHDGIQNYLRLRKSVQKTMRKAILSLKGRKDDSKSPVLAKDDEAEAFVALLKEAEAATVAVFESVFCLISGSRQARSSSGWSFISKVMLKKRVATEEEEKVEENVFAKQDIALASPIGHKTGKVHDLVRVQQLQDGLKDLNLEIQDLEEGLQRLHRRLIKSRVSLLNITSHQRTLES